MGKEVDEFIVTVVSKTEVYVSREEFEAGEYSSEFNELFAEEYAKAVIKTKFDEGLIFSRIKSKFILITKIIRNNTSKKQVSG